MFLLIVVWLAVLLQNLGDYPFKPKKKRRRIFIWVSMKYCCLLFIWVSMKYSCLLSVIHLGQYKIQLSCFIFMTVI